MLKLFFLINMKHGLLNRSYSRSDSNDALYLNESSLGALKVSDLEIQLTKL